MVGEFLLASTVLLGFHDGVLFFGLMVLCLHCLGVSLCLDFTSALPIDCTCRFGVSISFILICLRRDPLEQITVLQSNP